MAPDGFQFDVFLSHNSGDKPQVRGVAERLRDAGLRVWFDEWVIKPGEDIYLAVERGLEHARVLVLCLSTAPEVPPSSWWPGWESNPDDRFRSASFKPAASANFATRPLYENIDTMIAPEGWPAGLLSPVRLPVSPPRLGD